MPVGAARDMAADAGARADASRESTARDAAPGCDAAPARVKADARDAAPSRADDAAPAPHLARDERGLFLTDGTLELRADFSSLARRAAPHAVSRELVVRAAKLKSAASPLSVLDATAGLGDDAFLLASAGFTVDLYERDPTIAALLSDALSRALADPALHAAASRMRVHERDSIPALAALPAPPDVVLLDPMFPVREKSAAVKKKFQLLQRLERPCDDEAALLDAALAARPRKVVVKRPAKGAALAGRKPDYSLSGKAIRYDCYVRA